MAVGLGMRLQPRVRGCGRGYEAVGLGTRLWAWVQGCGRGYEAVGLGTRLPRLEQINLY